MSLEIISQVLAPDNAPYVNGVSAERRFAKAVLKNMFQGLVETGGRGIDDKFVTESDAAETAQVAVNRILPIRMKPREQGANKNGASFSANSHYVQTETVSIELLQVMDDVVIIPRARQDMIKVDLLAEQTQIFSDRLRTVINGATFACKLLKVWKEAAAGHETNSIKFTDSDVTNKNILNKFITGNSLLDEGDIEHGVDMFPEDTRICVVKPSYRATLKVNGVLTLGGANYAYDIAKGGAISHEDKPSKIENGYIGDIDGVPCHIISNESLVHASNFLGFGDYELKLAPLVGYFSSSWANARGVSASKITKVVDAQEGQGLKLQPYVKFGVASWYAKGTVVIYKTANEAEVEYNPIKGLTTLLQAESLEGDVVFKLKGAGSRLFPTLTLGGSSGAYTASAEALDDWSVSHVVAGFYYVGAKAKTIGEFIAGYEADGNGYTLTVSDGAVSGETISETATGSNVLNVLVISDDGSVALASK